MPAWLGVTGSVGAGKSTLLRSLAAATRRRWRLAGVLSRGGERAVAGGPAEDYWIRHPADGGELPWARRQAEGGYEFSFANLDRLVERLERELGDGAELVLLDELGRLEARGEGLAGAARATLDSAAALLVTAVRKDQLAGIAAHLGRGPDLLLDLDTMEPAPALRRALRAVRAADAHRIGAFAGIGGLVEVGLGSVLHAWRVPLKGHFLAYLQNLTLVTFGHALHGRGLARISLVEALLKAFSPMGSRLMPMLYIFLQGAVLSLPVALLGWHLPAVLLGSVLMAWLTLGLWLAVKVLTFGASFLDGLAGLVASVGQALGAHWTLREGLLWVFGLKSALALVVGATAWRLDLLPLLRRRAAARGPVPVVATPTAPPGWRTRARGALGDVLRWRFLLAFLVSLLVILFFARLAPADLATVALRGLCLSYLGFLLVRSLDLRSLADWLDRRTGLDVAASLPRALDVLRGKDPDPPSPDV
jgi:nucleoside-triphosphatase THEP1